MSDRNKYLGATDVAAVLGLSPWRSPYEVWAEKTGRLEHRPAGEAAAAGLQLERPVLDWFASTVEPIRRHPERRIKGTPILCHPDAIALKSKTPVEAKTSGITGPIYGTWGDPGTDQIPDVYLVQALVQIQATRADRCYVPALLGGRGFLLYQVPSHPQLQEQIVEAACRWWDEHVVGDRPPEGMSAPLEIVKRIRREPDSVINLGEEAVELLDRWQEAKERLKEAQAQVDAAQAAILLALGDAEAARLPDGRMVTYLKQSRSEYVVPATEFRVLRIRRK